MGDDSVDTVDCGSVATIVCLEQWSIADTGVGPDCGGSAGGSRAGGSGSGSRPEVVPSGQGNADLSMSEALRASNLAVTLKS